MDVKSHSTLELHLVLKALASYASFSASRQLAEELEPRTDLRWVQRALQATSEARRLLDMHSDVTIGGARDVRPQAGRARRGGVLEPDELLDIQATLISAGTLGRTLLDRELDLPRLQELAGGLDVPTKLIDSIGSVVDNNGEVRDQASPQLARIRSDLLTAQDRLTTRLQGMLSDAKLAPMLQDAIITQRDGRYVLPLKAEFKGKIKAVVHDQSSSGATIFVEPLEIVEANNRVRELELAERDEIQRILSSLSAEVGEHAGAIIETVEVLADLDLAFAKARYAEHLDASEPIVHEPASRPDGGHRRSRLHLKKARHPLLDPRLVVPIDLVLGEGVFALVITGPNTGGKTVALKTTGLLSLMTQCGLHIPVESGSELTVFEAVYADIGDEQSIEQSLSTFSAHVSNIIRILESCGPTSLVLLDELGAGTDPQEGAALARAIMDELVDREGTTLVATHYPELKIYAHQTQGVRNASVEFDLDTLEPTYHLTVGLPGRSNALAIARRLGLSEAIIDRASQGISHTELQTDELLDEIRRERSLAQAVRQRIEEDESKSQDERRELNQRLRDIESERRQVLKKAQDHAQQDLKALKGEIERLKSKLRAAGETLESAQAIQDSVERLKERAAGMVPAEEPSVTGLDRPVQEGDRVHIRSLNSQGTVRQLSEDEAEIQIGRMRMRAELDDLIPLPPADQRPAGPGAAVGQPAVGTPTLELDLRGRSAEEALIELDRRLDSAFMAEMPALRVIHGKGGGVLRNAVRAALQDSPYVESFRSGEPSEGGSGVTVIRLKSS